MRRKQKKREYCVLIFVIVNYWFFLASTEEKRVRDSRNVCIPVLVGVGRLSVLDARDHALKGDLSCRDLTLVLFETFIYEEILSFFDLLWRLIGILLGNFDCWQYLAESDCWRPLNLIILPLPDLNAALGFAFGASYHLRVCLASKIFHLFCVCAKKI